MPSKTDQLIKSISLNVPFTRECRMQGWPYDEKKPLDSLLWYPVYLDEQVQHMGTVAKTDDRKEIQDFCVDIYLNGSLMELLNKFRVTGKDVARYGFDGFRKEEKENVLRLHRIWIDDQFELIRNALEEQNIQDKLGKNNRELLRKTIETLSNDIRAQEREQKGPQLAKPQNIKERNLLRITKQEVGDHITQVAKGKKDLDCYLTQSRNSCQNELEELFAELNPLLIEIARLEDKLHDKTRLLFPDMQRYTSQLELNAKDKALITGLKGSDMRREQNILEGFQAELKANYSRAEWITLRIVYLQDRVSTLKNTYEEELLDERHFEEDAKRQLQLLKNIPRIEQAMNIYCASYKASFPLFLYIGTLVRGDGTIIQSGTKLGKAVDVVGKSFMLGAGFADIEKIKAFDTGSMTLSVKLGLSIGHQGGVTAKAGLAVEYNAGLSVEDDRTFQTISEFIFRFTAQFELPKVHKVALEIEIGKWSGGFIFQDHYHWAAWLAARWGHFCAKARACDIYMDSSNVGKDHNPDPRTLAELDRIAEQILNDNQLIQSTYAEIRQYLDYPVLRSKQSAYFEGGKLNIGLLGVEVEADGQLHKSHIDLFIVENENHGAVEYKTTYQANHFAVMTTAGSYALQMSYDDTQHHPITMNDGETINIQLSPLPPPELWVSVYGLVMTAWTGGGDVAVRLRGLAKSMVTLIGQQCLKEGALLEKTKALEVNFYKTQGTWALQYVRTRIEFDKSFNHSFPVHPGVYVDVGAEFQYVRTFTEALGWNSLSYPQYVHHGLKGIPKQKNPMNETGTTLRPDDMSGEELWGKFVQVHKNELWHLFMAIGTNQATIRNELAKCRAQGTVRDLITRCEQNARMGNYKLPAEELLPMLLGCLGSVGQFAATNLKCITGMKDKLGFDEISRPFNEILPAFKNLLNAEYDQIKGKEERDKKGRFIRVLPPPTEIVQKEVGKIFKPGDDQLIVGIGEAAQLQQETRKHIKACIKCLNDVKDYEKARKLLELGTIIPEKYWVDDKDVSICTSCEKTIVGNIVSTNKHHCRICGGIFHNTCSPERTVPPRISRRKIRVCRGCMEVIM